jgi:hypothetical protein
MGYDKCAYFADLMFYLMINKSIELKLQRIDHLGRPANSTIFGQGLRHPHGIGKKRHT